MITVRYGRYGGEYADEFDDFAEAARFIRTQEDLGQIFATVVSDERGVLWQSRHPLDRQGRWEKVRDDAPDWGIAGEP